MCVAHAKGDTNKMLGTPSNTYQPDNEIQEIIIEFEGTLINWIERSFVSVWGCNVNGANILFFAPRLVLLIVIILGIMSLHDFFDFSLGAPSVQEWRIKILTKFTVLIGK